MKKRIVIHGEVWFTDANALLVNALIKHQSSAVRSAYQAIHKYKLTGNAVVLHIKKNYAGKLNQRHIQDACVKASGITQEHSIFGGKDNWKKMVNGSLPKEGWQNIRNSQLYARGCTDKKGNPNIRICGNKLLVNNPLKYGKWIEGSLFIPKDAVMDYTCYDVRLTRKTNNAFHVTASYEKLIMPVIFDDSNGVVSLDINPDGVALTELDKYGNLLKHLYFKRPRLLDAIGDKRLNDIRLMAIDVVGYVKTVKKPLVIELLEINNDKKTGKKPSKKFNRVKHNFVYRKIIEAVLSRAMVDLVAVKEVEPAFTSILGILKYKDMYSLNRHTAAALVIGRRGMGIKEKQTFSVTQVQNTGKRRSKKVTWNLVGRRETIALTQKSWSWLSDCFLKAKPVTLTESHLDLKEGIGCSAIRRSTDESTTITGRCGGINTVSGCERIP